MKITELMHGDWVSVNCWPVKVISIGFDLKEETDDEVLVLAREGEEEMEYETYYASGLEPIILTPEILEKNGLVFDGVQTWKLHEKDLDIYVVPVQPDNEWWDEFSTRIEVCTQKSDLLIEAVGQIYVHQLQQFLRFCGSKKEIRL